MLWRFAEGGRQVVRGVLLEGGASGVAGGISDGG